MSRTDTILAGFRQGEDLIRDRLDDALRHHRTGVGKVLIVDADGKAVPGAKVRLVLKKHDFQLGANIFMLEEFECAEKNAQYRELFPQVFNLATVRRKESPGLRRILPKCTGDRPPICVWITASPWGSHPSATA